MTTQAEASTGLVSVVICVYTQDRWDDIVAAVGSVLGQSAPARELIIVVDHNIELYQRLLARFGADRGVTVAQNVQGRGLSGSKNTGVAAAAGEVVAFLDDDAVAEPDWLKFLADNYRAPEVAGVGGLTRPRWDTKRPAWFPREFDWVVGCNYAGMSQSRQVRNLLGGNASFRRQVFAQAGEFASGVGRSAGRLPRGCEETEFCIRLRQLRPDVTLLIDDRAVIWHRVRPDRCRFSYFIARCYAEGLSKAQVSSSVGVRDGMSAEREYVLAALPAGIVRNLAALLRGDMGGPGRAGAILAGLAAATAGYAIGGAGRRRG